MKRGVWTIIIICVIIAAVLLIYSMVKKKEVDNEIAAGDFGAETLVLIDQGNYKLACEDAKRLSKMVGNVSEDFAANPGMNSQNGMDNMTPAMKDFEAQMDKFSKAVEQKFKNDEELSKRVFEGIGEGVSNVFQASIMSHLGMIQPVDLEEYIDVTYCGATPKEGYVSPLEMKPDDMKNPAMPGDNGSAQPGVSGDNMSVPSGNR